MLACVLRRSQGTLLTLSTAARHSIKEPAQAEKGTGLLSAVKQFAKGLTFTLTSPTKGRRLSPSAAQGKAAAEVRGQAVSAASSMVNVLRWTGRTQTTTCSKTIATASSLQRPLSCLGAVFRGCRFPSHQSTVCVQRQLKMQEQHVIFGGRGTSLPRRGGGGRTAEEGSTSNGNGWTACMVA